MIHMSLPLKPRVNSPAETIITPLSIYNSNEIKILSITGINAKPLIHNPYISIIENKVGLFDKNFIDNDKDFLIKLKEDIKKLETFKEIHNVITCECGKFEELPQIRMYNQRRVKDNICMFCGVKLFKKDISTIDTVINWKPNINSYNKPWVINDLNEFKKRSHNINYSITKNISPIRIHLEDEEYGIRHQLIWAYSFIYLSELYKTNKIGIHFVNRVANIVFVCCSLLKTIKPDIEIHLFGLPSVWLGKKIDLQDISSKDKDRILKGMNSKRKDLKI